MRRRGLAGSFWPTDLEILLLRTALVDRENARNAWRQLRPVLRLDELEPAALVLLPLLHRRLGELELDDELRSRLRGIRRHTWYVNHLRLERLRDAARALADAGAEPLVVGSFELPVLYYGDLGARAVALLQVLVRPADDAAATGALGTGGWRVVDRSAHATRFRRREDQCVVYRRLFHEFTDVGGRYAPADYGGTAVSLSLAGVDARALGAADELCNVCLQGARPNFPRSAVWAADAAVVVEAAGPELDWDRVVEQSRRLRATLRLHDALSFLRRELDVTVPRRVLEALARTPTRPRERLAHAAAAASIPAVGPPPESLTRFLRMTADRSASGALRLLPGFLQDEWGLERRSQVALRAARKGAARLATAARHASTAGGRG